MADRAITFGRRDRAGKVAARPLKKINEALDRLTRRRQRAAKVNPASAQARPENLQYFIEHVTAAYDALALVDAENRRWNNKTRPNERVILASNVASLTRGGPAEIKQESELLLSYESRGSVSPKVLRLLMANLLIAHARHRLTPSLAIAEMNARLLGAAGKPRNQRINPEARELAITFIVDNPDAGALKIAKHAGVSRALIQRWINDDGEFASDIDRRGAQKHGQKWIRFRNKVEARQTRYSFANGGS